MPLYNHYQIDMIGENPSKKLFREGQIVRININNTDTIEENWVKESAPVCLFRIGRSSSISSPLWDTTTKEWQYHLTCIDGTYKGWETYLNENLLSSDEATRNKDKEFGKQQRSDKSGVIFKMILFFIFFFLLASYMFKG